MCMRLGRVQLPLPEHVVPRLQHEALGVVFAILLHLLLFEDVCRPHPGSFFPGSLKVRRAGRPREVMEPQIMWIARIGGREGEGEPQITQIAQMEDGVAAGVGTPGPTERPAGFGDPAL